MGIYAKYFLPHIINFACKQKPTSKQREKVVPQAEGNVLEIGIGSGLNLPYYNPDKVNHLTAIDPSNDLWKIKEANLAELDFQVDFIEAFAENIPADNNQFDSVITTYTLCSIPEANKALEEMRRVLKPNGNLIFCEHGKAPDKSVQKWQNIVNPVWKRIGGGCNLNREIPALIRDSGYKIQQLDTMYIPGWKPASFNFWGLARPN